MDALKRLPPHPHGSINPSVVQSFIVVLIILVSFLAAIEDIWAQSLIALSGALLALYFFITAAKARMIEFVKSDSGIFVAIFFLIITITVVPLPYFLIKLFSPATFSIYNSYGAVPNKGWYFLRFGTISLVPYKTLLAGGVLFTYAALSYSFSIYFKGFRAKMRMANLLILIATVIAFWGLVNMTMQNKKLFWYREIVSGVPTGPFINTIHFGHYMALCIPLALGMWIDGLMRQDAYEGRMRWVGRKVQSRIKATVLYLLPSLVMVVALFRALSRGAMVALCVSIFVLILSVLIKKRSRGIIVSVLAVIVLLSLLVASLDNPTIRSRILTLKRPLATESVEIRLSVWKDTIRIFTDFPLFGTGLNTFQTVFPKYKMIFGSGKQLFTHAENDYLETLAEVGVLGVIPLSVLALIILRNIFRNFNLQNEFSGVGILSGAIASVAAGMTGALSDYIFHIPAISLTMICVIFVAIPERQEKHRLTISYQRYGKKFYIFMIVASCVCISLIVFSAKVLLGQICLYNYIKTSSSFVAKRDWIRAATYFDGMNAEYPHRLGLVYFDEAKRIKAEDAKLAIEYVRKAKEAFARGLEINPLAWRGHFDFGSAALILASAGSRDSSFDEAQAHLIKSAEINSTDYGLSKYLVDLYMSYDPEKGAEYCKKMVTLRPYFFGDALNDLWNFNRSPYFLRKAVPDEPEYMLRYVDFLQSKGLGGQEFYRDMDDYLKETIKATLYYKNNPRFFTIPSRSVEELIKESDIIAAYQPESLLHDTAAMHTAALFYFQVEEYGKSAAYFRKLVAREPDNIAFKFEYASVLYGDGRYQEACSVFSDVAQCLIRKDKNVYK